LYPVESNSKRAVTRRNNPQSEKLQVVIWFGAISRRAARRPW
jgi:hypothetical protein